MTRKQKKRLIQLILVLSVLSAAALLVLYALSQNINLFYTPTQVIKREVPFGQTVRIGGMVVNQSVQRHSNSLQVSFAISDTLHSVIVDYEGILPDLFREGQGVVVQGQLQKNGRFLAETVLAKHDENYMPPEAAYAIKQGRRERSNAR